MPVQINEVIIRTTVDSSSSDTSTVQAVGSQPVSDAAVLELVLDIINEQSER